MTDLAVPELRRTTVGGIEVLTAPQAIAVPLNIAAWQPEPTDLHIHSGQILVFGTPDLGEGRVGYLVTGWDPVRPALTAARVARLPEDCPDCAGRSP